MAEGYDDLDRELTELGARWRAENPVDFAPREIRRTSWPPAGWLLTAAAAVVVIGAVIGTIVLSPGPASDPSSAPTSQDVVSRLDCAPSPARAVPGAPVVPQGAVAARLCGRSDPSAGFDLAWPVDTLNAADTATLVDAVNALRRYVKPDMVCLTETRYDLVLRYADGQRVRLHSPGTGCGRVSVNGADYSGAATISDLALRLIKHERQTRTTLDHPNAPLCPSTWRTVGGTIGAAAVRPGDEVAVTACQYRLDDATQNSGGRLDWQVVVNDPEQLIREARTSPSSVSCAGPEPDLQLVQRVLLVRDRFGDITVVSTDPCLTNTLSGEPQYPAPAFRDAVTNLFPKQLQNP